MKLTKIVYLVLALALPVSVFLFLKFFGKNQFDVEPFFKDGVSTVDAGCPQPPPGEYRVPVEILEQMSWSGKDSLTLYYFPEHRDKSQSQFVRIGENFNPSEVNVIEVLSSSVDMDSIPSSIKSVRVQGDSLSVWRRCYLFLSNPNDLALVDNQRRIRGYYQLNDREEIDRLLMEAMIILKKYKGE